MTDTDLAALKRIAALKALDYVAEGMKLGLGTGTTAEAFLEVLAPRVKGGLKIMGVASSERTAQKARSLGIPVDELDKQAPLDLTIDGADEADRHLTLIKGGGGALLREKIVATSSKKMVVIADDTKLVAKLGRFPLPVEVSTFGHATTAARIMNAAQKLKYSHVPLTLRMKGDEAYKTDGGNYIYDCAFGAIADAHALAEAISDIPGVVEHGLFVGIASALIIARPQGAEVIEKMTYDFDLFVIGGGSGGVRASRMAAMHGKRVAIAEEYQFGGTCVIRGCIPKKLFVYASQYGEDFEDAAGFGWTVPEKHFDWSKLVANKDKEIARLSDLYRDNVIKANVEIVMDRAEFVDPHTVQLKNSGRKITAARFLIATGGHPSHEADAIEGWQNCITSNEAFHLQKLPRRIVIAGGGYIGVEFAHIFHGLGCDVTLVCRNPKVLRGFDDDIRDCLMAEMHTNGIRVITERNFKRVDRRGDEVFVFTDKGEMIEADCAMLAIGRHPNTRGLGLEKAGVERGRHECVKVDEYSKSSVDHIYAIGDVTDRLQLTPVAIHEAMCFVKTVYEGVPTPVDHKLVPTAVFSRPEIGTVGLTEAAALEQGHAIDVYQSTFRPLKHTLSGRNTRARFKLVVEQGSGKILGCHIFGFDAAEIVQMAAVAVKMGATKADFDHTIALHPTAAEELVTMRTKSYSKTPG